MAETSAQPLPASLPGHYDSEGGREMAERVLTETRESLTKGEMSDFALANAVFMASRDDLALIVWQTAAKERIRWLSTHLAVARATIAAQVSSPGDGK